MALNVNVQCLGSTRLITPPGTPLARIAPPPVYRIGPFDAMVVEPFNALARDVISEVIQRLPLLWRMGPIIGIAQPGHLSQETVTKPALSSMQISEALRIPPLQTLTASVQTWRGWINHQDYVGLFNGIRAESIGHFKRFIHECSREYLLIALRHPSPISRPVHLKIERSWDKRGATASETRSSAVDLVSVLSAADYAFYSSSASLFQVQGIFWGPGNVNSPPLLLDLLELSFLVSARQQDVCDQYCYYAMVIKVIERYRPRDRPQRIVVGPRGSKKSVFGGMEIQEATRAMDGVLDVVVQFYHEKRNQ